MARPPLPIGAWGDVSVTLESKGVYRASARYRCEDGITRTYSRRRPKSGEARDALLDFLVTERNKTVGGQLTRDSTIAEMLDYWLESWKAQKPQRAESIRTYSYNVERAKKRLGGVRIGECSTGRIEAVLQGVKKSTPETARQLRNVLRQGFNEAVRLDVIDVNPVLATRTIEVQAKKARALTSAEVAALRTAAAAWEAKPRKNTRPWPKLRIGASIDLMLGTGLRIGELLALRWSDLDLAADNPTVTVSGTIVSDEDGRVIRQPLPKSKTSERVLYLPRFSVTSLMAYWHELEHTPDNDAIFPTSVGSWLDRSNYGARFREVRKLSTEVDLSWVTPHSLRDTVATNVYRTSDLQHASSQLGHSEIGVTSKHYVERENRGPAEVVAVMDAFVTGTDTDESVS